MEATMSESSTLTFSFDHLYSKNLNEQGRDAAFEAFGALVSFVNAAYQGTPAELAGRRESLDRAFAEAKKLGILHEILDPLVDEMIKNVEAFSHRRSEEAFVAAVNAFDDVGVPAGEKAV